MVNVAGRSKSCSTCRRRRVKCDETHPICNRCQKAGLDCDGPRGTTFIQTVFSSSPDATEDKVGLHASQLVRHESSLSPSPVPSLSFDNHERFICYSRKYFRRGASVDIAMNSIRRGSANATDRSLAVQNFEQAVLCFSTIMFGVDHGQIAIRSNGYTQHGLILTKLNNALSDPEYRTSDEVILTIVVLALLEGLEPMSPGSYLSHMLALEKLLAMRNVAVGLPISTVRICQGCRHMLVFASLRTRRATILSQVSWKSILRLDCGEDFLREQDLFDVLADCSALLERSDQSTMLACTNVQQSNLRHALLHEALSQLGCLSSLSERRFAETRDELWLNIGYQQLGLSPVQLQPTESEETSLPISEGAATELLLYYTALIWVYRLIGDILVKGTSVQAAEMPYNTPDLSVPDSVSCLAAERLAAEAICSCALRYLMTGLARHLNSSPIVHWAVTTAWETLGADSVSSRQIFTQVLEASSGPSIARGLLQS